VVVLGVMFSAVQLLAMPAQATASSSQLAIIEDDQHLLRDPLATLAQFRMLGADTARVFLSWAAIAPRRDARNRPAGFDAANPAAYPSESWDRWDAVVRDAQREGLGLEFTVTGGAPRWASGPGIPSQAIGNPNRAWKPSAREFGAFVTAVGARYSGTYPDPQNPGQTLPRVSFWSIWNEPNFGEDIAPQAIDGSTVLSAPNTYRGLVDAAWSALQATGHGRDTILIGELAAGGATGKITPSHPQGLPGNFGMTKPLEFVRALYCVDPSNRELRGAAAKALGCPTSRAGSSRFRSRNPGLFKASGFSDHPYLGDGPPNRKVSSDPNFASFPDLPRFERDLDGTQRVYGSATRFPIYNDEFGYITHPPNLDKYVSPRTAAYYINWAEYRSWRSPRIVTTMQYLLYDPVASRYSGEFSTGLLTSSGLEKPAYDSYRLPLYLPAAAARHGHRLEVWGCVRPASYAAVDTGVAQFVAIQFKRRSGGPFETLKAVQLTNPRGYFDTRVKFPASGTVRLAWTYPAGDPFLSVVEQGTTIHSRHVTVAIR
jgi:hypothetical protein